MVARSALDGSHSSIPKSLSATVRLCDRCSLLSDRVRAAPPTAVQSTPVHSYLPTYRAWFGMVSDRSPAHLPASVHLMLHIARSHHYSW